jgi:toxin secretion/phage lysis holin
MNNLIGQVSLVIKNEYIYVLFLFIIFDIITGTLKAFSNNTIYSKINKKGITNHITIFLFCIFFSWVFYIFKINEYANVLLLFYIVSYGLSIIENIGQMGLPLPQWLVEKFHILQDETNKGVEIDETKRNK